MMPITHSNHLFFSFLIIFSPTLNIAHPTVKPITNVMDKSILMPIFIKIQDKNNTIKKYATVCFAKLIILFIFTSPSHYKNNLYVAIDYHCVTKYLSNYAFIDI